MAELTIELSRAGLCGRFEIRIGYRADADAIPHEHEIHHRCLVQTLLPGVEIIDDPEAACECSGRNRRKSRWWGEGARSVAGPVRVCLTTSNRLIWIERSDQDFRRSRACSAGRIRSIASRYRTQ